MELTSYEIGKILDMFPAQVEKEAIRRNFRPLFRNGVKLYPLRLVVYISPYKWKDQLVNAGYEVPSEFLSLDPSRAKCLVCGRLRPTKYLVWAWDEYTNAAVGACIRCPEREPMTKSPCDTNLPVKGKIVCAYCKRAKDFKSFADIKATGNTCLKCKKNIMGAGGMREPENDG